MAAFDEAALADMLCVPQKEQHCPGPQQYFLDQEKNEIERLGE